MHIKTILNRINRYKGFVFGNAYWDDSKQDMQLVIPIQPHKRSRAVCSGCGRQALVYDHLPQRRFQFIPFWGILAWLEYCRRRVDCPGCGIKAERIPWAEGKQQTTLPYQLYLASWAEELPWKRVAERFRTSWQTVYRAVSWVVSYGLAHRQLDNVESLGIDEIQYQKGHKYLTVVYQLDPACRRLLWVGKERTTATLQGFFRDMRAKVPDFNSRVKFVCSDMWKAYLNVVAKEVPNALHILDRFHIRKKFSEALDKTRRQETKRLKAEGKEPVLTKSRWCFLKKRSNLTKKQRTKLKDLLDMNLTTVKAYLLVEQFEHFWTYKSPTWARKFMRNWTRQAMYSRIEPLKDVAKMLRKHEELILNWFRARKQINNGITEGLNLNIKLAMRKARGFRSFEVAEVAMLHQLGKLPKPVLTHEFW